jgi:hypothetical protein
MRPTAKAQTLSRPQIAMRVLAEYHGVTLQETGRDSFIFGRRLEVHTLENCWRDLKTGECGLVRGELGDLLKKFFPRVDGGAR